MNHPAQVRQRLAQPQAAVGKGQAWFEGAPATKFIVMLNVLLHLFIQNMSKSKSAALEIDSYVMQNGMESYRYWTSKITFGSTAEFIVGTALMLFLLRKYERELCTRKFIALYVITNGLCVLQEVAFQHMLEYRNRVLDLPEPIRWKYTGPYPIIGALFIIFHLTAPRLHPQFVAILGFQFSEKSFYYMWLLHLSCSGGWNTFVPTIEGCLSGALYLYTPLNVLSVPDPLVRTLNPIFDRLGLSHTPESIRNIHPMVAGAVANVPRVPQQGLLPQPAFQENTIPTPEPDPTAIEQLTSMGFSQQRVMEALRQTHNNVEHAANRLLIESS